MCQTFDVNSYKGEQGPLKYPRWLPEGPGIFQVLLPEFHEP